MCSQCRLLMELKNINEHTPSISPRCVLPIQILDGLVPLCSRGQAKGTAPQVALDKILLWSVSLAYEWTRGCSIQKLGEFSASHVQFSGRFLFAHVVGELGVADPSSSSRAMNASCDPRLLEEAGSRRDSNTQDHKTRTVSISWINP